MSRFGSDSKSSAVSGSIDSPDAEVEPEAPGLERRESLSVAPYGAPSAHRTYTIFDRDEIETNKPGLEEPPGAGADSDSKKPGASEDAAASASTSASAGGSGTDLSRLLAELSGSSGVAPPPTTLLSRSSSQDEEDDLDSSDPFELALSGLTSFDIQSAFNSPYLLYLLRTDSLAAARKLLESANSQIDVSVTDDKGFTTLIHLSGASRSPDEGSPAMNAHITSIFAHLFSRITPSSSGDGSLSAAKASLLNAQTKRGNTALIFACRADGRDLVSNLILDQVKIESLCTPCIFRLNCAGPSVCVPAVCYCVCVCGMYVVCM